MIPVGSVTADAKRRLVQMRLIRPLTDTVRPIGRRGPEIAIGAHGAVPMIAVEWALGRIDRNLMMIDAEAVALRIAVREQPRLQHFIGRIADARYDIGRSEGHLLDLREYVARISMELKKADLDQGIVSLRPHLRQIEWIE